MRTVTLRLDQISQLFNLLTLFLLLSSWMLGTSYSSCIFVYMQMRILLGAFWGLNPRRKSWKQLNVAGWILSERSFCVLTVCAEVLTLLRQRGRSHAAISIPALVSDLRHEPLELACVENVSAQFSQSISHGFVPLSCHSCHTHCCFIKRFLPITSLLSVINANESRNCDERLLISTCAAPAPNSACLPLNKTPTPGSQTLKALHTSAGDVFLRLILASKQFD